MRNPIALIAVAALAAAPAAAGDAVGQSFTFRFDREVLDAEAGAEKIYRAMRARAWSDCDPRNELTRGVIRACVDAVVGEWVQQAGDDRLRALHAAAG